MPVQTSEAGLSRYNEISERFKARGPKEGLTELEIISVSKERSKKKLKEFRNDVACMPNEWTRSGLFTVTNKNLYAIDPETNQRIRKYVAGKIIPTFSENVKMTYTGYLLNIFDQTVFMTAIREAKSIDLEKILSLTQYEFCEAARMVRGKKTVALIEESFSRMFSCSLKSEIYRDGRRIRMYHRHLINKFQINDETKKIEIALPIDLADLYSHETTYIKWEGYHALKGEIAKALVLELCSHEARPDKPQHISLEGLRQRIGSSAPIREFRRLIKMAATQVQEQGFIKSWKIENDVLVVIR
jgi:hypothetical protein